MTEDHSRSLLELMIHVSREVAAALDLRTVLQSLLSETIQHVGGEHGSIVVLDDTGKPVDATIIFGAQVHNHSAQKLKDTVEYGLAGWVVKNRRPALVGNTSQDARWLQRDDDAVENSGAKSAICVPLMAREQLVGVMTLVHSTPDIFNAEHLELTQAIADQASVAVLNARLYTESQRTARVMTSLAEGAAAINSSLEMPDVWRRVLNQTMQALQVETVALALIDNASGELVFRAAAGYNSGNIPGRRIPPRQGLAWLVAGEGRGLVLPSVRSDPRYSEADLFGGIEMRDIAIAPIQAQGRVIGVIEAINPASGIFDPDALVVMTGLGSLAGTTIQNAEFMDRLQKAHKRYRELFEDSVDPIVISDWSGRILEANRQMSALSGYPDAQLREMKISQLHEVNQAVTGPSFEKLHFGGICNYESNLVRSDGGTMPVTVHAHRVEFEENDSIQWTLRDITERKELDALRDDMIAMIYHDIRSPLGNIVSSLEMMNVMLPEDQTLASMLNIARSSTARIQRLVNSLLDINRLEAGQKIAEQAAVEPMGLVQEALRDVEPLARGRQQALSIHIPHVLPFIWVDGDMVHRVFVNLLENAIKYTPVEGRIEIGGLIADGNFIRFWVKDNGPGILPVNRERIFDKFTRLRGPGNRPAGLGVGLAFCRLAVLGHGGQIGVESEPGQGSSFWFTLPVAQKKGDGRMGVTGPLSVET